MRQRRDLRRSRGFVLLVTVLSMIFILSTTGLAIDVSMLYLIKARLSAAVDAGAIGGARSLARGISLSAQAASADATARAYFRANFPNGYLMTPGTPTLNVAVTEVPEQRIRRVTINGSVLAPLFFLRYLGGASTLVSASGRAERRDTNVILVIDRTGSLGSACPQLKSAAKSFVSKFAVGTDKVGLVTFARTSAIDFAMTDSFKPDISNIIDSFDCAGYTGAPHGLSLGYTELQRLNEEGALNVVLFFTDGIPNTIFANWPIKSSSDCQNKNPLPGVISENQRGLFHPNALSSPPRDPSDTNGNGASPSKSDLMPDYGTVSSKGWVTPNSNTSNKLGRGCAFRSVSKPDWGELGDDVNYIPLTDWWGNSISSASPGWRTMSNSVGSVGWQVSGTNLVNGSANALLAAAQRIRSNNTLDPVIFSIGLGSPETWSHELLRRVANDPAAATYATNRANGQATGLYVFAPDGPALAAAFARVASEILRLAE